MGFNNLNLSTELLQEYLNRNKQKEFIPGKSFIPPTNSSIDYSDIEHVIDVVLDGWFTEYKEATKFKTALSSINNKSYTSLVNSGSSANLVAVSSVVENKEESYILTCASGFPTTIAPIYQNKKIPLYVDVDPYTLTPKFDQIVAAIEQYKNNLAAIVLTHNLGFAFNEAYVVDALGSLSCCIPFIVDGCDALGSNFSYYEGGSIHTEPVGSKADIITYSFFPAHIITTGEGGALSTNEKEYHDIITSYINWGRSCYCMPGQVGVCGKRFSWPGTCDLPEGFDHKYIFDRVGYNLKMTEIQAALGMSQLSKLDKFVQQRKYNYDKLYLELSHLLNFGVFLYERQPEFNPFGFPILLSDDQDLDKFIAYLEQNKIGTRRFFAGNIVKQPGYFLLDKVVMGDMSGADILMNKLVWIGCHPSLNDDKITYMIEVISKYFGGL